MPESPRRSWKTPSGLPRGGREEKATMGIIVSYKRVQDTHGRECLRTFVDLELTHVFRLILNGTEYFTYAYITKQYIFTFPLLYK